MRAILMFHNCEWQSHKTVSTDLNLEEKGEPKQIWTNVFLLTSLTPYYNTKLAHNHPTFDTAHLNSVQGKANINILISYLP